MIGVPFYAVVSPQEAATGFEDDSGPSFQIIPSALENA
jgi:hypothetical protein